MLALPGMANLDHTVIVRVTMLWLKRKTLYYAKLHLRDLVLIGLTGRWA